ncbi:hypothetical protein [Paracoccus contaminans]|nr:hypothetical protein [Paracoccus contaminans]
MILPPRREAHRGLIQRTGRAGRDLPVRAMFIAFEARRGCRGNRAGRGRR